MKFKMVLEFEAKDFSQAEGLMNKFKSDAEKNLEVWVFSRHLEKTGE